MVCREGADRHQCSRAEYAGGDLRKPEKIEAIIEGGEANSRTLVGRFVTGDHGIDISLIKESKGQPAGAVDNGTGLRPVRDAASLHLRYPHGRLAGKA